MSTSKWKAEKKAKSTNNETVIGCCICGKKTIKATRQPFPKSWPQHLRIYNTETAHRKCIDLVRKVKTEYSAGLIHKRWQLTPGLGKKYDKLGGKVTSNKHVNIIKPEQNWFRKPFTPNARYKEDGSYVVSCST